MGARSGLKQTFYSIQALRGLAASLVVIAHIFEHPSRGDPNALLLTGRFGVEIFFVISGFVMTHVAGEGSFAPAGFAFRRIMRIVPIYWVCTVLVFAVALVAPALFKTTTADVKHLVLSLFFIPAPDPQAATDWRPLFKLGWTLNYEMFFYVMVALALLATRNARRGLALAAALLCLLVLSGWFAPSEWYLVRFYQSSLFLEFLSGVLLWVIYERSREIPARFMVGRMASAVAGGFLIAGGIGLLLAVDAGAVFAGGTDVRFLQYGLPAVLVVAGGLLTESALPAGRWTTLLVELGDASYALYLFHPFVILFLSRIVFEGALAGGGPWLRLALLILATALALTASVVVNRYIDGPIQRRLRGRVLRVKSSEKALVRPQV
jgi:exopolysaccharide production protein ExoZ